VLFRSGNNANYVKRWEAKNKVSFAVVRSLKRGGAYVHNLKYLLEEKSLKSLFDKVGGEDLHNLNDDLTVIIENSWMMTQIGLSVLLNDATIDQTKLKKAMSSEVTPSILEEKQKLLCPTIKRFKETVKRIYGRDVDVSPEELKHLRKGLLY